MNSEGEVRDIAMSAWAAVSGGVKAKTAELPFLSLQRKLDMDLVAINAALDAFKTVALAETTKLRHQRNSLSPISQLPVEITSNIFIECLPDHPRYNKYSSQLLLEPVRLSSICQTWRAIAQSTPGLWTMLDTRTVLPLARILLQNSGGALISVVGPIKDDDESETEKSFLAACQHKSQWSSVNLTAPYTTDFNILDKAVVPNLKSLTLLCESPPEQRVESLCLFRGKTPRLERVRLTRVAVDWNPSTWRNLQSISLKMVEGPDAPLFFDSLEACPGLRSLALQRFNLTRPQTLDPTERPPISLPALQFLSFRSSPLNLIALCLSILKCPALTRLNVINPKTEPGNIQEHLDPIASFARDFIYQTTSNEHIIEIMAEGDTFAVTQQRMALLGFWTQNLEGIGERFCRSFTADPERVVACIGGSKSQAHWSGLECLPGCTTVKAGVGNLNFFRYLGTSTTDDGGVKRWPFPNMHTLIIYGSGKNSDDTSGEDPDDALERVMKRYTELIWEEQDVSTGHPAALRKLVLTEGCSMDLKSVVVLEMMLGTGTVVHEDGPRPRDYQVDDEILVHWGSDSESESETDSDSD